eukprot:1372538-Amorphochlora_amoeboformis.AAC.2
MSILTLSVLGVELLLSWTEAGGELPIGKSGSRMDISFTLIPMNTPTLTTGTLWCTRRAVQSWPL